MSQNSEIKLPSEQPNPHQKSNEDVDQLQPYQPSKSTRSSLNIFRSLLIIVVGAFVIGMGWLIKKSMIEAGALSESGAAGTGNGAVGLGDSGEMYQYGYVLEFNSLLKEFYKQERAKSLVDINCGFCIYARNLQDAGLKVQAYSSSPLISDLVSEYVTVLDWSLPQDLKRKYDWAQSFSLGTKSGIQDANLEIFVENVVRHVEKGIVVVGWGLGDRRLVRIFEARGFAYDEGMTGQFRSRNDLLWFGRSLLVFRRVANGQIPSSSIKLPDTPTKVPTKRDQSQGSVQTQSQTLKNLLKNNPSLKYTANNLHNSKKQFHQLPNLSVQIGKHSSVIDNFNYDNYGFFYRIQVGSQFDFAKIREKVDWGVLENRIFQEVAYEELIFRSDAAQEPKQQVLTFTADQITSLKSSNIDPLQLGVDLAASPTDAATLKRQYFHYNSKYQLDSIKQSDNLPICIFAMGTNLFRKGMYKTFFESVSRQNYTNYHIVYVDAFSEQENTYKLAEWLISQPHQAHVRSRLTFLNIRTQIGGTGNIYLWIRKYCGENDIVTILDADSGFVGAQALQVMNSYYRNSQLWYVYTTYINQYPSQQRFNKGTASGEFITTTDSYRRQENVWITSHLKTFRKKLLNSVPIRYFLQYHYNPQIGVASPSFYAHAFDRFLVYSLLQVSSQSHLKFQPDYLYQYNAEPVIEGTCFGQHEYYDEFKARVKTPLGKVGGLGVEGKEGGDGAVQEGLLEGLRNKYNAYRNCMGV